MVNDDVWVVIPVFNEAKRINEVLAEVKKYVKVVVVINDGSTDNTIEMISKHNVFRIECQINEGKASALLRGCEYAKAQGAKHIMDGDGQHDPEKLPEFIQEVTCGSYDIIFGSRSVKDNMPLTRHVGNIIINLAFKILYGKTLTDVISGYKAFTIEAFDIIKWDPSKRYLVESDIFINAIKAKLRWREIMIPCIYNNKFTGIKRLDGFKILWNVIKRRFYG